MTRLIQYTDKAAKQLRKIFKSDSKSGLLIMKAIENYASNTVIRSDVKILKGRYENLKRLRAGNYRIIFDENMTVINIYEIKHRQEAYHD